MSFKELKDRIKKNEGYSDKPYQDQLGFYTIGYGHLITEKELLIEMIFQLGAKGVSKFKKMLYFLNKKQKYMASLEMLDSLWYLQTPERVKNLIKNYTKK